MNVILSKVEPDALAGAFNFTYSTDTRENQVLQACTQEIAEFFNATGLNNYEYTTFKEPWEPITVTRQRTLAEFVCDPLEDCTGFFLAFVKHKLDGKLIAGIAAGILNSINAITAA
jgi:hypothetical protein